MREEIPPALDGERLDRVVAMLADVSRSVAATAIDDGRVTIDDVTISSRSDRVRAGQVLGLPDDFGAPPARAAPDADVELDVLHVDDDIVVIDKRAGQVVHPGAGHRSGTIAQGVLARFPEVAAVGEPDRPGVVHRLDKGTTGALVLARSAVAYESLVSQLRDRLVRRRYLVLAHGVPASSAGLIDAPIGRAIRDPTRMSVRDDGKAARTRYQLVAAWESQRLSWLRCELETGRTHQIRVHLDAIGHPVVGDPRYGSRPERDRLLDRPALHAAELGFVHPVTGRAMDFTAPVPDDLRSLVESLGPPTTGTVAELAP